MQVLSSHICASYLADDLVDRFALVIKIEPEIDLWGASNDLTAIALKHCRNARLKLGTKLRNCAKKTDGYVNS